MKIRYATFLPLLFFGLAASLVAQVPTEKKDDKKDDGGYDLVVEDSSMYQTDYSKDTTRNVYKAKKYATNKVQGLSPNKLITLGYDFQSGFGINSTDDQNIGAGNSSGRVGANHGLRLGANFPVISRNNVILNLQVNYLESRYDFTDRGTPEYAFYRNLANNGLRSTAVNVQVFKPLNEKHFILAQVGGELNGDYNFNTLPTLRYIKPTGIVAFGWKRNDRSLIGVGGGYVWRGGGPLIVPVLLWNQTFNRKWGMELLLPARGHVRYNWSPRTLTLAGFELEGGSYVIRFDSNPFNAALAQYQNLELRKSELRFRLVLEREIHKFIWFSLQAGWRYNFQFNIAENATAPNANTMLTRTGQNILSNTIGNPLYVNINIHLVSF
jgi:hypothetical protein